MAFQEVGERVERLETVLANFIQHSDAAIAEVRHGAALIREDIAEMRLWRIQSQTLSDEGRQGAALIREDIAEMRQWRIQSQTLSDEMRQGAALIREDIAEMRQWRIQSQTLSDEGRQGAALIREDIAEMRQWRIQSQTLSDEGRQGAALIREDIAEMRQWRIQSQTLSDEMRQGAALMRQDIEEMRQWRVQSQKQWGEIAQKMGSFVEDIVAPNIPRIGRELFGLGGQEDELFSSPRVRLRNPNDSAKTREFDYVYATSKGWVVVESKKDPRLADIDDFLTTVAEAKDYFPQYAALPLFPIFASLYMPGHVVSYCTSRRVYAMGMGSETMQLLNLAELAGGK